MRMPYSLLFAVAVAGAGCKSEADGRGSPAAPPTRTDLVRRGDTPLTLVGRQPEVGAKAPDATLRDADLKPVELASVEGKLLVLSVVPSIDTRVCESQTHHVSDAIAQMPPGTEVMTISRDLPFAQRRFAEEAMTKTKMLSDYKERDFGRAWGLEVAESGLLARSVWVIGADGTIRYREIVADQTQEPDYDALLAGVKAAAGG
ncbi:MAG TPA: thiol peroxidase [Kofleriaceae bacterium]|nr:thiol peroxidase [Kofleriaceae bacterium]